MDKQKRIKGGYIILSRNILEHEVWRKPPLYLKVWIYLIARAQYSVYKDFKRGQLFTSIPKIQEACAYYIGYRKVTPTKDQIFNILDWMRSKSDNDSNDESGMITTMKATHGMVITIVNYDFYQEQKNYANNSDNSKTETSGTTTDHDNINKHYYEGKASITNYISDKKSKKNYKTKNKFHNFMQTDEDLTEDVLQNHANKKFEQILNEVHKRKSNVI